MDPEDFYVDPSTDLTRSGMAIEEWLKEDEKNKLLEPEPEVEAEAPQDGGVSTETQTEQPQEKPKAEPKPAAPSRQRTVTAKADTRTRRNLMRGSAMREPVISTAYNEQV